MGTIGDYVIIDTETTGTYDSKLSVSDPKQARIMQIAWAKIHKHRLVETYSAILRVPLDTIVNEHAFAVHGLTTAFCTQNGVSPIFVQSKMDEAIEDCAGKIVGHNVSFDIRMLELLHTPGGMQPVKLPGVKQFFCTMKNTKEQCGLQNVRGALKNPKLGEAFRIICGREPIEAHDALADVFHTWLLTKELDMTTGWVGY